MTQPFPQYETGEIIADGVIHVLSICASVAAAIVLIGFAIEAKYTLTALSLSIYCVGFLAVFFFSAAYNLVRRPDLKSIFRRFDHAAIYLKVAATYTPFAMIKLGGWPSWVLMATVWAIALFGLANKLLFPTRLVRVSYVLYLVQGWAALLVLGPLIDALTGPTLVLLGVGGALYTIGVVFHLWEKLRYHNAIWHGFVLTASACHYAAVLGSVAYA